MTITIHQVGKAKIDNGLEKDPVDNMSFHYETKGEDIVEQKEDIVAMPESSETD